MNWRRVSKYHLQGDGYSICLSRVGDAVCYQLWRDVRRDPDAGIKERVRGVYERGMPDLLRTITGVPREDETARRQAVAELQAHADACLWADRTGAA